jgi:hypothetical protein
MLEAYSSVGTIQLYYASIKETISKHTLVSNVVLVEPTG